MDRQPDQLSKLLLEADGLLLLLHKHREETPLDAIKLLRKKLQLILALTEGLDELLEETGTADAQIMSDPDSEKQSDETGTTTDDNDPQPDETHETHIDCNPTETPERVGEYIEDTVESSAVTDDDVPEHISTIEPIYEPASEQQYQPDDIARYIEDNVEDAIPENDIPQFISEDTTPCFMDEDSAPTVFMADESTDTFNDDNIPLPEPEPETQGYHRTYIINESTKVKESHTSRRPISSVFNLNDKFRFRRELFGNSDAQYVECLDMLSAMKTLDEAKEYLFEDLCWDPDNDDAKAFIDLLANYYQ